MYCIVPIQYCDVMYCIPNFPDKVLFVHRSYVPRVRSYSVLVYNLQSFAKIMFCLVLFFQIPFVLYLFNLVDDIISDVNDDFISDITDDVIMHGVISDVFHHTAPKTNVSHPHPQGQATQIQTAVHTRWLSKLTCRWHAGQDYNCKYCGYLGKGWHGSARARVHLSGEKRHGVAACPNVPKKFKEKLLNEAEEKL